MGAIWSRIQRVGGKSEDGSSSKHVVTTSGDNPDGGSGTEGSQKRSANSGCGNRQGDMAKEGRATTPTSTADPSRRGNSAVADYNCGHSPPRERSRGRTRTRTPPLANSFKSKKSASREQVLTIEDGSLSSPIMEPTARATAAATAILSSFSDNGVRAKETSSERIPQQSKETLIGPLQAIPPLSMTTSYVKDSATGDASTAATIPHEFVWRAGGNKVYLTGSFDRWSQSILMAKDQQSGIFKATVMLDPAQTWYFKFIVDGIWRCSLDFANEADPSGNVNNVIYPNCVAS